MFSSTSVCLVIRLHVLQIQAMDQKKKNWKRISQWLGEKETPTSGGAALQEGLWPQVNTSCLYGEQSLVEEGSPNSVGGAREQAHE